MRAQPLACLLPGVSPSDSLGAVLVAGQLLQLAQLGDRARRVQRHADDFTAVVESRAWRMPRPRRPRSSGSAGPALAGRAAARVGLIVLVLLALWGLWEAYRATWLHFGFTRPFVVDQTTMPHIHDMVGALFEPSRANGPLLIDVLFHSALFTAKEAAVGFVLGAGVGFALGVVLAHSRLLTRGLMPYVVASQTIPILAIAPMVVIGLGSLDIFGWTPSDWQRVAVIAAYLSFFPVTINTVRGLNSADPRAVELMRSYAAVRGAILWKLRFPASLAVPVHRAQDRRHRLCRRRDRG